MKIFLTILTTVLIILAATYLCLRFYFAYKDNLEVQKAHEQLEELKTQDYHSQLYLPPPKMDESKMPQNGKWY
jgi:cell division protein FtsL